MSDGLNQGEEGEGYFASVSDMMVGVLFIFLLMLTVFALNFRDDSVALEQARAEAARERTSAQQATAEAARERASAQQAIAEAARERASAQQALAQARRQELEAARLRALNEAMRARLDEAADKLKQELAGREARRVELLEQLAAGLKDRGIQFKLDAQSGVLRLSEAVPFDVTRSELTDTGRRTTVALSEVLAKTLPCFAETLPPIACPDGQPILEAVLVEGHTDDQTWKSMTPEQSQSANDRLSTERALSVFTEMRRSQPSLDGLFTGDHQPLLGISGYGQRRPLPDARGHTDADWAKNRRIDLRFVLSSRTSDELRRLLDGISALQRDPSP